MATPLLIVKNITHEGAGLLESLLLEYGIASHSVDLSKGEVFPDPCNYKALVALGGPQSANDETPEMQLQLQRIREALHEEIPFLGICLGIQTLVKAGGGKVVKSPVKEIGFIDHEGHGYRMEVTEAGKQDPLFAGLGNSFSVFQLHGETVELAASGMELLGTGKHCPVQAVRLGKNAYGLQCHFEVTREMLSEWCDIDSDLKAVDRQKLLEQYDDLRDEYTATSMKILSNFLRIATLV